MSADQSHELCTKIGSVLAVAAPDGWQHISVERAQLGTFSTTAITYDLSDGSRQPRHADDLDDLDDLFLQLKVAAYEPDKGTWFLCQLDYSLHESSYNSMEQTLSIESPFGQDIEVPASAYVEELSMFPRRPDLMPAWITAAWPEDVPPLQARHSPPAPMDGESGPVEPRLSDMVARVVGRDDDSDPITFGIAENENGTGNVLIFFSSEEMDDQEPCAESDTYCVTREYGAGTTYGGVTHCDLGFGRLTLHFTNQAAHELNVESILRIDLQVDDAGIEVLRHSLREILLSGHPDQHPQHMHL